MWVSSLTSRHFRFRILEGVTPFSFFIVAVKWLWLEKPLTYATSAMDISLWARSRSA
jgi:hypothetical protein